MLYSIKSVLFNGSKRETEEEGNQRTPLTNCHRGLRAQVVDRLAASPPGNYSDCEAGGSWTICVPSFEP